MINFGTQSSGTIYLGTQAIIAAYWGTQSLFPTTQEVFIYIGHANQNSGSAGNTITKINQSLSIQWQRPTPWLSGFGSSTNALVAKNNKIYTSQQTGNPSNAGTSSVYDANGLVLGTYSRNNRGSNAVDVDSLGNIIFGGQRFTATAGQENSLIKLSTTFSVLWRYDHNSNVSSVSVDGSNNVYFGGLVNTGSVSIRKLNSSGVSQWSANHGATVNKVLADTSGNLYIAGLTGTSGFTMRKYNTSGTLQWSRGVNTHGQLRGLAFDSSGNIWAAGATARGNATWSVAEYDTNGTPLGYYNFGPVFDIQIDSSDNIYVVNNMRIAKYTSSGVLSWTYSVPNNRSINAIALATY
jgi:hypothetical protein